jgi:putative spermidine/putrescine transport system substrate-binding protein
MISRPTERDLNRRRLLQMTAGVLGGAAAASVVRPFSALAQEDAWTGPPDSAKAGEQAKEFTSYGMGTWANYEEVVKNFQTSLGVTDGKYTELNDGYSSLEEITAFDAEKSKPAAMVADIGLLWGKKADEMGVVPKYLPPSAEKLPAGYKSETGGWVATFTGVPAFVLNLDAMEEQGLPEPKTWDDLLAEEWKGRVGSPGDPQQSGTAQTTFLAWSYAHGGDAKNLDPAVEFAKKIIQNYNTADSSLDLLEKGEIALWMRYDFNCQVVVDQLKEKGVNAKTVIPGVSIFAPSALIGNGYFTERADAIKSFLEYVLSDEAALTFAKFGARPIGTGLGYQTLPDEAKAGWLPEDSYKDVVVVEDFTSIDAEQIASVWAEDVLGG